jgi:hypothetical protein
VKLQTFSNSPPPYLNREPVRQRDTHGVGTVGITSDARDSVIQRRAAPSRTSFELAGGDLRTKVNISTSTSAEPQHHADGATDLGCARVRDKLVPFFKNYCGGPGSVRGYRPYCSGRRISGQRARRNAKVVGSGEVRLMPGARAGQSLWLAGYSTPARSRRRREILATCAFDGLRCSRSP